MQYPAPWSSRCCHDVDDGQAGAAKSHGAELLFNAAGGDPSRAIKKSIGGVHGAIVTAVSPKAFEQSLGVLRNGGTVCWIGLPGGESDNIRLAISSVVNGEISIRGSNVGTRQDLQEAVEFAASGLVKAKIEKQPLAAIDDVFARMKKGAITGRALYDGRLDARAALALIRRAGSAALP